MIFNLSNKISYDAHCSECGSTNINKRNMIDSDFGYRTNETPLEAFCGNCGLIGEPSYEEKEYNFKLIVPSSVIEEKNKNFAIKMNYRFELSQLVGWQNATKTFMDIFYPLHADLEANKK